MAKALEIVSFRATAPSTGATFSALAGNSTTIRDSAHPGRMLAAWQTRQAAGYSRVTSPLLHDGTVGLQMCGPIGLTVQTFQGQRLTPQDTLSVYGSGSATAGDMEFFSFLAFYPDLTGVSANLITATEFRKRFVSLHSFPNTLATTATGEYTGSELISAESDQLKANTRYALLGANIQVGCHALCWSGPDFGNLRVGMPGGTGQFRASEFFLMLAEATNLPCIPVISSANKALTYVDAVSDENGTDPVVTTMLARLS